MVSPRSVSISPYLARRPSPMTRAPVINDVLAWIECITEAEHDAGDHLVVIGRVVDLDVAHERKPLVFFRGGYGRFEI